MENFLVHKIPLERNGERFFCSFALCSIHYFHEIEADAEHFLHPKELKYYHEFQFPKKRMSYLLGHYLAKNVVAHYLSEPDLASIEITSGLFNQPLVKYLPKEIPEVSISHSSQFVVAIAYGPGHYMGIDVEDIDGSQLEAIKKYSCPSELKRCPSELNETLNKTLNETLYYFILWSVKEALSKTIKVGFTSPFSLFEIESLELKKGSSCWQSHFKNFKQYQGLSWLFQDSVLSICLPAKTEMNFDFI